MRTLVHDASAGPRAARLVELGLSAADFEFVLAGADAEARTWTTLAPPVIAGMARWGKTNELLRVRQARPAIAVAPSAVAEVAVPVARRAP
ncbi:MAG: hypothetical protein M3Y33_21395 [Actinomycetota bacterium]|nr:hypothetical protein [Actinomycetota bacterium]